MKDIENLIDKMRILPNFALAIATASASSIWRKGVIAHDEIVGFNETVPSGDQGDVYLAFKPYLKRDSGCVPYPAVDAEGNTR